MRKLMLFLIALLAVFNLIATYASYNDDRADSPDETPDRESISELIPNKY